VAAKVSLVDGRVNSLMFELFMD